MTAPAWMPLYVADYLADTGHLSAVEHGGYLLLIMHYWRMGGLPSDEAALARIARMTAAEWKRARPQLIAFFHDGWRHKRVDAELIHATEVSSKRRAAALGRHNKSDANAHAKASDMRRESESPSETDSSSLRSDETRETALAVRQPDAEPPVAPDDFPELPAILERRATAAVDRTRELNTEFDERFWPAYPHKVGKPDARKAFRRARKAHSLAVILFGLDRYVAEKPPDRPRLNPATFLNQERFNDQPASTENRASASPHDAILGAVARQFAPRDDPDRGQAGAGGGLFDEPRDDPGNRGGTVELGQGDYRRTA